jgi:hypothetical protein
MNSCGKIVVRLRTTARKTFLPDDGHSATEAGEGARDAQGVVANVGDEVVGPESRAKPTRSVVGASDLHDAGEYTSPVAAQALPVSSMRRASLAERGIERHRQDDGAQNHPSRGTALHHLRSTRNARWT